MPDVTVVAWNIETFGDRWNATRGANYLPLCRHIGRVLMEVDADIFFMMELRSGGIPYLATLRAVLDVLNAGQNFTWEYDYIPGAVVAGQAYPIGLPGQLGFTQRAHGEGYAVFWRDAPEFTMRDMRVPLSGHPTGGNSYINLVFDGRTPTFDNNSGWLTAPDFDPAAPPAAWNQLDFPEPNPIHAGDIRWTQSRRPAYAVLDLNRGGGRAAQLLPILIYHAPNSNFSTRYGVQCSAYSSVLYQVDDTTQGAVTMVTIDQAIAAGDYNLDWNQRATQLAPAAYLDYTNDFDFGAGTNVGGAELREQWVADAVNPAPNRTAIHLSDANGTINSNNPDDYRWLAIDNLFFRDLNTLPPVLPAANYHGQVYNVIADLLQGGDLVNTVPKRNVLQAFRQAVLAEVNTGNYPYVNPANNTPSSARKRARDGTYIYSGPVIGNLLNYTTYMNDLNTGYFANARQAAEFYWNSVSDHLPVVFRFTV
ncbi:MAG TPA: hypothetical protein VGE04_02305 [Chloroflexia bacterium]|jgi:hypothetical protein